jgi:hypothetical protein
MKRPSTPVATHVRATVGMRSRTAQVRDQKRGSAACSTHLHEEAVHARGHARARDGGDEVAQPARGDAAALERLARRLLQRVCDVRHDGAVGVAHPHQVARVHDQVRVAEHGAALAHHHVGVAGLAHLGLGLGLGRVGLGPVLGFPNLHPNPRLGSAHVMLQRWKRCESLGISGGRSLTRPFRDARRFPSTRL